MLFNQTSRSSSLLLQPFDLNITFMQLLTTWNHAYDEMNVLVFLLLKLQKDRFRALNSLAKELVQGNYHAKDAVKNR